MWDCPHCGEKHEDSFEVCWNCGSSKDGTIDPSFRRADDGDTSPAPKDSPRREAPVVSAAVGGGTVPVCPKCGSREVIPDVRIVDRGDNDWKRDLEVEVYDNPGALIFKGTHAGTLRASVCGRCGYAELYVTNSEELLASYRRSKGA
jgi:predicted nucleic-acid-binding Zn-ribbon protein